MNYYSMVRKLFSLFLTFLQTSGEQKQIAKKELNLFLEQNNELVFDNIPDEIKQRFSNLFSTYAELYKTESLHKKRELEDKLWDILEDLRSVEGLINEDEPDDQTV